VQRERYSAEDGITVNADAEGELLDAVAEMDGTGRALLAAASSRFRLSARGYHRVLRVARTIADLEASDVIAKAHVAEALGYRLAI
jgi:magnesium chelatase family protein